MEYIAFDCHKEVRVSGARGRKKPVLLQELS